LTAPATASDRIAAAFGSHGKRAALMPYLMGGFPDLDSSREIGLACADAGADLLELGIPFSDPLADGPVIHAAATAALAAGATPGEVLRVCEELAPRVPVVLMVYANLVLARGAGAFVDRAAAAGAAGLIVPDLPHDESAEALAACDSAGIALVPLAAPSLEDTVARVREAASVPVAVGFGIARPEQASRVADIADGVIVGSRLVRAAGEGGAAAVSEAVAELAAALA